MKLLTAVCLLFVVHSVVSKDTKSEDKTLSTALSDHGQTDKVDDVEKTVNQKRVLTKSDLQKKRVTGKRWLWGKARRKPRPKPRRKSYGQGSQDCYASGDPHYTTFDGLKYNFMGECRYVQATDGCGQYGYGGKATFKIVAINKACGRRVSCVRGAEVTIGGETVHLKRNSFEPAPLERPGFTVTREGRNVVVRSSRGITVYWDRNLNLKIWLDKKYREKVCGMCGNFDGNKGNDQHYRNKFQNICDIPAPIPPKHPCDKNRHRKAEAEKDCAVIKSQHFKDCAQTGIVDKLYEDCRYDACAGVTPVKESTCESIEEASQECKDKGKQVNWGHLTDKCKCRTYATMHGQSAQCCVFPFISQGVKHYKCAPGEQGGKPWCATVPNADQNYGNVIGECQ